MTWPILHRLSALSAAILSPRLATDTQGRVETYRRKSAASCGSAAPIEPTPKPAETPLLLQLDRRFHRIHNRNHEAALRALDLHLTLAKGCSSKGNHHVE